MDIGFKHTHVLIVVLYLLQLLVKVVLVAAGKKEALEKFSNKTKIPHMVLATLMLLTGGYLLFKMPGGFDKWVFVKLALIVISIPLGIIGSKRNNFPLLLASFLFLAYLIPLSYTKDPALRSESSRIESIAEGKEIYSQACQRCHGEDGAAGYLKAKNLQESQLSAAEMKDLIKNGKKTMPAYPDLTDDQLDAVVSFIQSLKANPSSDNEEEAVNVEPVSNSEDSSVDLNDDVRKLFKTRCSLCHGEDGAAGLMGAKNLAESDLKDKQLKKIIKEGKGQMPPNADLTDKQIEALADYVKQFRPEE